MEALKLYQSSSQLMWRFFFGLLRTHSSKTTTKLFEKFAHIHTLILTETILLCAYELKQTAIAEVLVRTLNHSITGCYHHPSDCAAIGYALSLSSHQFNKIKITRHPSLYPAVEYDMACFISMFAELPESNGVVQVTLSQLVISNRTMSALAQFVHYFPNLQQLEMSFWPACNYIRSYTETVKSVTEFGQLEHLRQFRIKSYMTQKMVKE